MLSKSHQNHESPNIVEYLKSRKTTPIQAKFKCFGSHLRFEVSFPQENEKRDFNKDKKTLFYPYPFQETENVSMIEMEKFIWIDQWLPMEYY